MFLNLRPLPGLGILKTPTPLDPDILVDNPVAISTRVAPSFLRVGQLELFARRARSQCSSKSIRRVEHDSVAFN